MISKEELYKIAESKGLTPQNAEKEYFQNLLLFHLYKQLGRFLAFKGGTCLQKVYGLNRFSEDLDFTLIKRKDIQKISEKIMFSLSLIDVKIASKEVEEYGNEINVRIKFIGPLYNGSKESLCYILLNFSLRERVILPLKRVLILPVYREIPSFDVFSMEKEEIFGEKIRAIMTRNKARDVYDLWFLLECGAGIDLQIIAKKLSLYKIKFDIGEFEKKLFEKEKLWKSDLKPLIMGELPDFGFIKNKIMSKLKST